VRWQQRPQRFGARFDAPATHSNHSTLSLHIACRKHKFLVFWKRMRIYCSETFACNAQGAQDGERMWQQEDEEQGIDEACMHCIWHDNCGRRGSWHAHCHNHIQYGQWGNLPTSQLLH